ARHCAGSRRSDDRAETAALEAVGHDLTRTTRSLIDEHDSLAAERLQWLGAARDSVVARRADILARSVPASVRAPIGLFRGAQHVEHLACRADAAADAPAHA